MKAVVIDFETTGLVEASTDWMRQPSIVQIGAALVEERFNNGNGGLSLIDSFQSLVNPERTIPEEVVKIHGINNEKVKDAPTLFGIFPKFAEFVKGADMWVGYNSKYDRDVLWYQLQRYGFERNFPWPLKEVDVMKLASNNLSGQGKQGVKRWKLVDAYFEAFGRRFEGAHDAMNDVIATAELFIHWSNP